MNVRNKNVFILSVSSLAHLLYYSDRHGLDVRALLKGNVDAELFPGKSGGQYWFASSSR